jgi:hypothetical protein
MTTSKSCDSVGRPRPTNTRLKPVVVHSTTESPPRSLSAYHSSGGPGGRENPGHRRRTISRSAPYA